MANTEWIGVQRRVPRRGERVFVRTPLGHQYEATLVIDHLENWPQGASWTTPMLDYNLPFYAVAEWRPNSTARGTAAARNTAARDTAARETTARGTGRAALPAICVEATQEAAFTRMALKEVLAESLGARPAPGLLTLGELAAEVVALIGRMVTILRTERFDVGGTARPAPAESRSELMQRFAQHWDQLIKTAAKTDAAALRSTWTLLRDGAVVYERPRGDVLRLLGLSPLVHYRGQLVQSLRMVGIEVKPFYAPWELPSITPPPPEGEEPDPATSEA